MLTLMGVTRNKKPNWDMSTWRLAVSNNKQDRSIRRSYEPRTVDRCRTTCCSPPVRVEDFSPAALKAIAALELLAAPGLILPAALDIAPVLVPLAAGSVVLLFAGAVIMRLRRAEKLTIVPDLVYLAMAAFVAWGRFGSESFTS